MTPRRATSLRPGQFKHLIRVASVTGRLPERDVMLLWLTHTTGIRVTELALLEVADVLYPSGAIKPEVYLRADITKGCRPRNVYLTHARCLAALDAWLVVRYRRRWGLSGGDEYRGFRPGSKWSRRTRGKPLSWHSNIASWAAGRLPTALVMRCNRQSPGSTGRPVSNRVRPIAAGGHLRRRCWLQPATLKPCRQFWVMRSWITASHT